MKSVKDIRETFKNLYRNNEFIIEYYDSADQPVIQEETPPDDEEDEG